MIKQKKELHPYRKMLDKALRGQYDSAVQMREDLVTVLSKQNHSKKKGPEPDCDGSAANRATFNKTSKKVPKPIKKRKAAVFFETFLLVAIISMLYVLYIYEQLL
ncbi:hypothetical protein RCO48_09865 [Peribacillus frigoritolerans]|nr:hypothetical protein [Peribacillus frigoritolerans]